MNRADLADAVARRHPDRLNPDEAVVAVLDAIADAVAAGATVRITGFGRFDRVTRAPRLGRNPRTGETVPIPAKYGVQFRPGPAFLGLVRGELAGRSATSRRPATRAPQRVAS